MAISSGDRHTCGLWTDGSPVCWGDDEYGKSSPPQGERFSAISSGYDHTCALREDGTASLLGVRQVRRVVAPEDERFTPSAPALHTCALREDGTAVCWGPDDPSTVSHAPGERAFLSHQQQCLLYVWHSARTAISPLLGKQSYHFVPDSVFFVTAERFTAIGTGSRRRLLCALRHDGSPSCWIIPGLPFIGVDGLGPRTYVWAGDLPPDDSGPFTAISAGGLYHTSAHSVRTGRPSAGASMPPRRRTVSSRPSAAGSIILAESARMEWSAGGQGLMGTTS